MTAVGMFLIGFVGVCCIAGAVYAARRRQALFARVPNGYLASRRMQEAYLASRTDYGLFLERPGTPFDAGGLNTNGKTAEHVCSFVQPCLHHRHETARAATEAQVKRASA